MIDSGTNRAKDEAIAATLGVSRRTLSRWKRRPDVALALRVHELRAFVRERPMFWRDEVQGPLP